MRRMNSFGRQGLVAAMENEELNTPEVAEAEGGAENLETDLLEVQEEAAEADAVEAQIEETVETAEALEGIAISLEACAANGGLTKDAAHVVVWLWITCTSRSASPAAPCPLWNRSAKPARASAPPSWLWKT